MKQAVVFLRDRKAGVLTEDENGYTFQYDRGCKDCIGAVGVEPIRNEEE